MRQQPFALRRCLAAVITVALAVPAAAQEAPYCPIDINGRVANVFYQGSTVLFEPLVEHDRLVLTVATPCSTVMREFRRGETVSFDVRNVVGQVDGTYTWELRVIPIVHPAVQRELQESRNGGDPLTLIRLQQQGLLPTGPMVDSAAFTVVDGRILPPEEDEGRSQRATAGVAAPMTPVGGLGGRRVTAADQVIPDDLIVQGSACVGFDCVNNESFNFDTIRLKENNLRIHFDDTSTIAGYPANDWRIIANDSASGGASKFCIEDSTGAKTPFTIRAGAATNALFVDSTGRVGFRTSTPVLDLHVNTSNTPALRLEQNSSGGFTAQTWDVGANEANFFVRDVTGGSKLSFRIRPGAPTSSLDISADGDVGIGTASPASKLHVASSDSAADAGKVTVRNTSGTTADRELLEIKNDHGSPIAVWANGDLPGTRWTIGMSGSTFIWNDQGDAPVEMSLDTAGNLTITGAYSPSDRNLKRNVVPVDGREVLARLAAMPVSVWSFKTDEYRHMGPMSQDFAAAFGLGIDDKTINAADLAGVSLAAAQALNEELRAKDAEIATLRERLAALEAAVAAMARP